MSELTAFKNQIFFYGIIVAALCELASLPFLGLNRMFSYGLALGTAIAIVNFNIMEFTLKKALAGRGGSMAFIGYILRLLIYGGAFYMSMRVGTISGLGTLLGFLTLKAAIYYLHGFKAKFSKDRKVRPEVQAEYEKMDLLKEEHKSDRLRDKIRNELSYQEDEVFYEKSPKKTYRTYKRKKLSNK
ncbi:ATP synthase subunit I [Sinanaerobacter chloroacetimidivorans]|jgi:hypothetical protein|uniref:ATP synthase subunit I n=1 Tax=Sinanaerobacter chloroacetimidivorans TaxID=2818044 RepID=A0A8J7W4G7_9FIRM|nr:ATP synthase subunit I [Sinanaerobacter chloroacetimidivorans]MBR0599188.1 ATP synthase subunit I [Sinanaerobacter chloroacetimidivorans]